MQPQHTALHSISLRAVRGALVPAKLRHAFPELSKAIDDDDRPRAALRSRSSRATSTRTPSSASRSTRRRRGSPSSFARAASRSSTASPECRRRSAREEGQRQAGRDVAILGEYDALPEIGHACGHNLIAASAVGAFLAAAAVVDAREGEVVFLGTPAEEGGGGKIKMIEAASSRALDAAMMFHPFDRDMLAHPALASVWLAMTFRGAPAHAAAAPHDGKSALTACMDTFRLVDGQRVRFRDGVRVHGYITNGGQAVNIIPELAACEFSVRARDIERARARSRDRRALRRGRGAGERRRGRDRRARRATATCGTTWRWRARFGAHLGSLGRARRARPTTASAPEAPTWATSRTSCRRSIRTSRSSSENEALCHQHAFAAAAASDRGFDDGDARGEGARANGRRAARRRRASRLGQERVGGHSLVNGSSANVMAK